MESYKLLRQPGILYDEEKIKWLDEIGTDQTQCYYSEDLVSCLNVRLNHFQTLTHLNINYYI